MCAGLYFYQPLSDKQHCQKVKVMLGIVWSLPHNQKTRRGLWIRSLMSLNWPPYFWCNRKFWFQSWQRCLVPTGHSRLFEIRKKVEKFCIHFFWNILQVAPRWISDFTDFFELLVLKSHCFPLLISWLHIFKNASWKKMWLLMIFF